MDNNILYQLHIYYKIEQFSMNNIYSAIKTNP